MKIIWFVASLEQMGGGERFAQETVLALKTQGHDAIIVCDRLATAASFNGRYDLSQVVCLNLDANGRAGYARRAFSKFYGSFALIAAVRKIKPDLIICQSEYDAIKVRLASSQLGCKYRVFVFGQMFQFKTDISKYSTVFRRHVEAVVASRPGYRDTVTLPPPRLSLAVAAVNEIVSRLKYSALRKADKVFALSNQVKWEVGLLYDHQATVARAAVSEGDIDEAMLRLPQPVTTPLRFLSVCRLVDKKRVDLIIRGFDAAHVDGVLHIVGAGPELDRLRTLAQTCASRDNIKFLGTVDDRQLAQELEEAHCFVSMDIGDFDISVVEAMAKARRVIVAKDFDMSEFGDDFDGVTVVTPDVNSVAQAMRAVPTMSAPSVRNLTPLRKVTWQWLAVECAR